MTNKQSLYRSFSLKDQAISRAQYLLAMREHGAKELKRKLLEKLPDLVAQPDLVAEVIEICQQNDWQSDTRYIESYTRMAIERGQGWLKIRHKLQETCDNKSLIEEHLQQFDNQIWLEQAQEVLEKKYGDLAKPKEPKEFAKRLRFLQSRGFSAEQCYKAFK